MRSSTQDSIVIPLAGDELFELEGVIGSDTLVTTIGRSGERDIFAVSYRDPARRTPLVQRPGDQFLAAISPSGRWLAYSAVEGGAKVLMVEAWPVRGGDTRGQPLRIGTARNYIWDDTDQLYFVADGFVNRRRVTMGPDGPTGDLPIRLTRAMEGEESGQTFAPSAGGRALITLIASADAAKHLVVVRHWERELARLVK